MLTRTNRLFPLRGLRDEIESAFTGLLGDWPSLEPLAGARVFPALNIWEDDENLYAEAEVAGLTLNEIELVVMGNELTLRGQRREGDGRETVYHCRERGTGSFQRIVRLPVDIDASAVEASLKNGVLGIKLPKAPSARPRRITVQARDEQTGPERQTK